jgi:phage-related protein
MTSEGSKTRLKWEGNSNKEIREWPADVRADIGLELDRLDNYEDPLKSKPMGSTLPGVSELTQQDKDLWYRLFYWLNSGWIYVLHCFNKKTNRTDKRDIQLAKDRIKLIKERKDEPFVEDDEEDENEKSA